MQTSLKFRAPGLTSEYLCIPEFANVRLGILMTLSCPFRRWDFSDDNKPIPAFCFGRKFLDFIPLRHRGLCSWRLIRAFSLQWYLESLNNLIIFAMWCNSFFRPLHLLGHGIMVVSHGSLIYPTIHVFPLLLLLIDESSKTALPWQRHGKKNK